MKRPTEFSDFNVATETIRHNELSRKIHTVEYSSAWIRSNYDIFLKTNVTSRIDHSDYASERASVSLLRGRYYITTGIFDFLSNRQRSAGPRSTLEGRSNLALYSAALNLRVTTSGSHSTPERPLRRLLITVRTSAVDAAHRGGRLDGWTGPRSPRSLAVLEGYY